MWLCDRNKLFTYSNNYLMLENICIFSFAQRKKSILSIFQTFSENILTNIPKTKIFVQQHFFSFANSRWMNRTSRSHIHIIHSHIVFIFRIIFKCNLCDWNKLFCIFFGTVLFVLSIWKTCKVCYIVRLESALQNSRWFVSLESIVTFGYDCIPRFPRYTITSSCYNTLSAHKYISNFAKRHFPVLQCK